MDALTGRGPGGSPARPGKSRAPGRSARPALAPVVLPLLLLAACSPEAARRSSASPAPPRTHLATLLADSEIEAALPQRPAVRDWSFAEGLGDWHVLSSDEIPILADIDSEILDEGVRLTLLEPPRLGFPLRVGGLRIRLPEELHFEDWDAVQVEAKTSHRFAGLTLAPNVETAADMPVPRRFFSSPDLAPPMFSDGSLQTYSLPLRPTDPVQRRSHRSGQSTESPQGRDSEPPPELFSSLAILFAAPADATVEVRSVRLLPRGAGVPDPAGRLSLNRDGTTRDTVYAHAPARWELPLGETGEARLDLGLTVDEHRPVTYRIAVRSADGEETPLLERRVDDSASWTLESLTVPSTASGTTLVLSAEPETDTGDETLAYWGAPVLTPARLASARELPDVIFYVIDGGDADLMSAFGYERPTTPFLEELAAEGVLFTRAHSNATWTQPSTVSFMTSLQHSVLGGLSRGVHSTAVPPDAVSMADHFRRAGYLTISLTANPNAGRIIGLQKGVDILRDVETEHHSTSSLELQRRAYELRDAYGDGPSWIHLQTTDVHEPNEPHEPYAGRWVSDAQKELLGAWDEAIWANAADVFGTTSVAGFYDTAIERANVDRTAYYEARKGLYDETMLHQDEALRQLVDGLKSSGEWENTLLVIGSDHGHPAGTFARFGRGLVEPRPEPWQGAMADAWATRVPLLVVWPGTIEGGRRIDLPVSMLDVLPTLLDLVGLPSPEVAQGRSLAPALRGGELEPRPVLLDEFRVDEATGEMIGNLEMIDGRWAASLEIRPIGPGEDPRLGRHEVPAGGRWGAVHRFYPDVPRLLLFDLEKDPYAVSPVNDEHPRLVEKYTRELLSHWEAHRALSQRFRSGDAAALSPEQLEQLRSLGYIR